MHKTNNIAQNIGEHAYESKQKLKAYFSKQSSLKKINFHTLPKVQHEHHIL